MESKEMWIKILRACAWVMAGIMALAGLAQAFRVITAEGGFFFFILIIAITAVAVIVSLAPYMIITNMAEEIIDIRETVERIYLNQKSQKSEDNRNVNTSPLFKDRSEEPKNGEWRCSKCESVNSPVVTRCSCGNTKGN